MTIRLVKTTDAGFKSLLKNILERRGTREGEVERRVAEIVARRAKARRPGAVALHPAFRPAAFDGGGAGSETGGDRARHRQAWRQRIWPPCVSRQNGSRRFTAASCRKAGSIAIRSACCSANASRRLERVGVYVPGGKASYPSTVLMNAIPAKVAGVKEIIMTSPIGNDGAIILAAAHVAGVDRIFRVGGAQAVAALAFGTRTIPKVDKIVGPGNIFVATAKRMVFGEVNIDSIAGPSEILLLADDSADPVHVAADMLSQAEHDELAAALCVTTSMAMA